MLLHISVVFVDVIQQRWIDQTHAGCLRASAFSMNPGLGARCIQAGSGFHPESVREKKTKKQTHKGGCWHTLQELWPCATCDSFWWKMPLHVTVQACAWIFADSSRGRWGWLNVAVSLTLFWFICLWMSTRTHHRTTEDIMCLRSQARVTESSGDMRGSEWEWWCK